MTKVFINFFLFLLLAGKASATQAIRCQGNLYSLDYALIKNQLPFGPLFGESEHAAGPFVKFLLYSYLIQKLSQDLQPTFASYFDNLNNQSDFSKPIVWQSNELPFPKTQSSAKDLAGLSIDCLNAGSSSVEILTVVQTTKKGKLTIYEFNSSLFSELSKNPEQLAFFYMSVFLEPFRKNLHSGALVNAWLHSTGSVHQPQDQIQKMANENLFLKNTFDVCKRSALIVDKIQNAVGIPCEEVTAADLLEIQEMKVEGQGYKTFPFVHDDFLGLSKLTKLELSHMDKNILDLPKESLKDLTQVKHLSLTRHWINETPKNFMEGPFKLQTLDLSLNNIFEIKRNAFRNVFLASTSPGTEITLNLSYNTRDFHPRRTVYVHPGSFDSAASITVLLMKDFNLTELSSEVFTPLTELKVLDLSENRLKKMSEVLNSTSLANLRSLDLSDNSFTTLDGVDLSIFRSLEKLYLRKNALKSFPLALLEIPSLKELTFCGSEFSQSDYEKVGSLSKNANPYLKITFCK